MKLLLLHSLQNDEATELNTIFIWFNFPDEFQQATCSDIRTKINLMHRKLRNNRFTFDEKERSFQTREICQFLSIQLKRYAKITESSHLNCNSTFKSILEVAK